MWWYSDSTTALAAIRRQGTQKLSKAALGVNEERPRPGRAEKNHDSLKTRLGMSQLRDRRTLTSRRGEKQFGESPGEKSQRSEDLCKKTHVEHQKNIALAQSTQDINKGGPTSRIEHNRHRIKRTSIVVAKYCSADNAVLEGRFMVAQSKRNEKGTYPIRVLKLRGHNGLAIKK